MFASKVKRMWIRMIESDLRITIFRLPLLLRRSSMLSTMILSGTVISALIFFTAVPKYSYADAIGPLTPKKRAIEARNLRLEVAKKNFLEPLPAHPANGDEAAYATKLNSYTKGLPHDDYGLVDPVAYQALIYALKTGQNSDFEAIPTTVCAAPYSCSGVVKLRNPHAAYTYFMEGKDSHSFTMPVAPAFDSAYQAAEAIEVMWQAITRDVSFFNYATDNSIGNAAADMSRFSDFRGPKNQGGSVTPEVIFRGIGEGELEGPYISQFLLKPIPFGAVTIEQKYEVPVAGNDHLVDYSEWLNIQRGSLPSGITVVEFETEQRYLYNGRALAQYVLKDFINEAYLNAARIISGFGSGAYGPNDPYRYSTTQARGPLFGNNHAIDLLSRVSMGSQNVAWYQKWLVHRRARPEVFFGHVHNHIVHEDINYPFHQELLSSPALNIVHAAHGTYLLPMATPSGSPLHPTYPAGHATMAGAAATMLKALFKGNYVIPNPVQPSADGLSLLPYNGVLTIEGELNKLASNISLGRDTAGVHYRSDGDLGMILGEEYAISVLRELVKTYSETFSGFTFNKFDGSPVTISK